LANLYNLPTDMNCHCGLLFPDPDRSLSSWRGLQDPLPTSEVSTGVNYLTADPGSIDARLDQSISPNTRSRSLDRCQSIEYQLNLVGIDKMLLVIFS
jgi:hypothetical protein